MRGALSGRPVQAHLVPPFLEDAKYAARGHQSPWRYIVRHRIVRYCGSARRGQVLSSCGLLCSSADDVANVQSSELLRRLRQFQGSSKTADPGPSGRTVVIRIQESEDGTSTDSGLEAQKRTRF